MWAAQVFNPDRAVMLVEDHPGCQGMQFDAQPVRISSRDFDDALSRAAALMAGGRERGEADPFEAVAAPAPVVWIALTLTKGYDAAQQMRCGHGHHAGGAQHQAHQLMVA